MILKKIKTASPFIDQKITLKSFYFFNEKHNLALENKPNFFYSYLENQDIFSTAKIIPKCFALKLALIIIETIRENTINLTAHKNFPKNFYEICLKKISAFNKATKDKDLLIIYIKQLLNILKRGDLIKFKAKKAFIPQEENLKEEKLYIKLFNSFWNKVKWEEIFPSNPEAANKLKINRSFMKDLLLNSGPKISLDSLANDFFDLTGFGPKNNLVLISFLDFYFFTWLKHFGIISYYKNSTNSPVYIETTPQGKKILQIF